MTLRIAGLFALVVLFGLLLGGGVFMVVYESGRSTCEGTVYHDSR